MYGSTEKLLRVNLSTGALAGQSQNHADFEKALTCLYGLKGWYPETTIPSRQRLEELSLGWAADLLERFDPSK